MSAMNRKQKWTDPDYQIHGDRPLQTRGQTPADRFADSRGQTRDGLLGMENEIATVGLNVDFVRPYTPPSDTHLWEGDPHRGKPDHVFMF